MTICDSSKRQVFLISALGILTSWSSISTANVDTRSDQVQRQGITLTTIETNLLAANSSQTIVFQTPGNEGKFFAPLGQSLNPGSQLTSDGSSGVELTCPNTSKFYFSGRFDLTTAANNQDCSITLNSGGATVVASSAVRVNFGDYAASSNGGIFSIDLGLEDNQPSLTMAVLSGSATLFLEEEAFPLGKGGKYSMSIQNGLTISDLETVDIDRSADRLARILTASSLPDSAESEDSLFSYSALRQQYLDGFRGGFDSSGNSQDLISPVENYTLGVEATADTEDLLSFQGSQVPSAYEVKPEVWNIPASADISNVTIDTINSLEVPHGFDGLPLQ